MGEFGVSPQSFSAFHVVFTVVMLLNFYQVESKSQRSCPLEFRCGNISQVSFPFSIKSRPYCGFLILDCDAKPYPTIEFGEDRYEVLGMGNDLTWLFDPLLDSYLQNQNCNTFSRNLSLPNTPLISSHVLHYQSLRVFRCNHSLENNRYFSEYESYHGCKNFTVFYTKNCSNIPGSKVPNDCSPIQLPLKLFNASDDDDLFQKLSPWFGLTWNVTDSCLNCHYKGGRCLVDDSNNFQCSKGTCN